MTKATSIAEGLASPQPRWVGDGFPVRTMFSVHSHEPASIRPFLLPDHAGPHDFPPGDSGQPCGVDQHPHRGFETVTILHQVCIKANLSIAIPPALGERSARGIT